MSFFLGLPGRPGGSVKLLRLDLDRSGGRDGGRFRLDGGFDLVEHLPRLQLRIGLRLFDADGFASLDAVVIIMGVILLRAADYLAVELVLTLSIQLHPDGLVALVRTPRA